MLDEGDQNDQDAAEPSTGSSTVTWTASEFVAHDKSAGWYLMLAVATLILAAAVFFITRDYISLAVVIVGGTLLGIYGSHKPRQMEYVLDGKGIGVGQKHYGYNEFRCFSVATDEAFSCLVFMPLKRFAVPLTIYYAPGDEDRILDVLSDHLPFEEYRRDAVDSLMKRIRF